jgi:hypothetical protein
LAPPDSVVKFDVPGRFKLHAKESVYDLRDGRSELDRDRAHFRERISEPIESRPGASKINKHLTKATVFILAGPQVDRLTADSRLLGHAAAARGERLPFAARQRPGYDRPERGFIVWLGSTGVEIGLMRHRLLSRFCCCKRLSEL